MKSYRLMNDDGKLYSRLDCPSALSTMRRFPGVYEQHRVFFADERTALAAEYRPCGNCLRQKYREYMNDPEQYRAKFGVYPERCEQHET